MNKAQRDLYKQAMHAVSMRAPTQTPILNKLSKISTHSDDAELRRLVDAVVQSHRGASHVPAMPLREMSRCKVSAEALEKYCRRRLEETPG